MDATHPMLADSSLVLGLTRACHVTNSLPLALDGVDLRIEARERVGICGRAGALRPTSR